ncbi:MAG: MerR family transcriptional regulator [Pseudolabrys sp.]|nr:MerR family transcriptional regulator [Pseudolabrys sp.]
MTKGYGALAAQAADPMTIADLAREAGVTQRALRFYQSKGLLTPQRNGSVRLFGREDRERLTLIQQGKRLGFTLGEIRDMLAARDRGGASTLPVTRKKCVEQIALLERQRTELEMALAELRQIYTRMFVASEAAPISAKQPQMPPEHGRLRSKWL